MSDLVFESVRPLFSRGKAESSISKSQLRVSLKDQLVHLIDSSELQWESKKKPDRVFQLFALVEQETGISIGGVKSIVTGTYDRDLTNWASLLVRDDQIRYEFVLAIWIFLHTSKLEPYALAVDRDVLGMPLAEILRKCDTFDDVRQILKIGSEKSPPIFLPDPHRTDLHSFAYSGKGQIPILGRGSEQAALVRFLKDNRRFLWLQLAGVAGQGKSRLGWDLIQKAREDLDWEAGFWSIPPELSGNLQFNEFVAFWESWSPDRPCLLVVDYVVVAGHALAGALQSFMERSSSFEHPVRVLFLERQSWNSGGLMLGHHANEKEGPFRIAPSRNHAAWFDSLNAAADRRDLADPAFQFEYDDRSGVIELKELSETHLVDITRQVFKAKSSGEELPRKYHVASILKRIDGEGRPLYPYLLGQAMADGDFSGTWTREDLLNDIVTKDQKKRWSAVFGDEPPSLMSDEPALSCAVLATIAGGVSYAQLLDLQGVVVNEDIFRKTLALVNGPYDATVSGPAEFAPPLLPDLLGEWFALKVLEKRESSEQDFLAKQAWSLSPIGTLWFLTRTALDFPNAHALKRFFKVSRSEVPADTWHAIASSGFFVQFFLVQCLVDDLSAVRSLYGEIARLVCTDDQPEVRVAWACAAVVLANAHAKDGDFDNALAFYDEIAQLTHTHDQLEIRRAQILAARDMIIYYAIANDPDAAGSLYDEITHLMRTCDQPEIGVARINVSPVLAAAYARAKNLDAARTIYDEIVDQARTQDEPKVLIARANIAFVLVDAYSKDNDLNTARALYDDIAHLARTHDQPEIRVVQATAVLNLANAYAMSYDLDAASRLYDEIAHLASDHDQPEIRVVQANVARNMTIIYANDHLLDAALSFYNEICDLVRTYNRTEVRIAWADASMVLAGAYAKADDLGSLRTMYDEIAYLARTYDQPEMRKTHIGTAQYMIAKYAESDERDAARALYDEITHLARTHYRPEIHATLAYTASVLIDAYINAGDLNAARALHDDIAHLARAHDDQPGIAELENIVAQMIDDAEI